jgi:DnaJ family protein B protein 12
VALVLVLEVVQVSHSSLKAPSLTFMVYFSAVFTFGPGFRTVFTRGGGGTAANNSPRSLLVQLAPLLILFALSILSNLPSLFSSPPVPDPRFSFSPTTKYHTEMESGNLGIHYYVNPSEFSNHPVIGAEMAKEGVKAGWVVDEPVVKEDGQTDKREPDTRKVVRGKGKARGPALKKFEDTVERVYTNDLYSQCQRGIDRKQRAKDAELGIFGIGVDWDRVKEIEDQIVPSCKELERLGLFR